MLLHELIDNLWSAKISGNDEEIRQAYAALADIGIYKESADIILKEWHPDRETNIEFIIESGESNEQEKEE
ncbi:MAG: hypothetical protein J6U54_04345 [Clostridiales bacterium]|nr:hypothetical protein [Clostridiales bacterium]